MITFCPTCANMLLVRKVEWSEELQYYCQTCPYIYNIDRKITKEGVLEKKEMFDILGGEAAYKNVAKTQVPCPKCQHGEAYFREMQTRSADEPATLTYKCVKCDHVWKEG